MTRFNFLASLLFVFTQAPFAVRCQADGISLDELIAGHDSLQADAAAVEGTFRIYRVEQAVAENVPSDPRDIGVPLVKEGYVWRSGDMFRLKYTQYKRVDGEIEKFPVSAAMTLDAAYQFASGLGEGDAMLEISEPGTDKFKEVRDMGRSVVWPIDALWSNGGTPIMAMIQRPDTTISEGSDGKVRLDIELSPNEKTSFQLLARRPFPLVLGENRTSVGEQVYKATNSVTHTQIRDAVFPKRVVERFFAGDGGGFLQVTDFELQPLTDDAYLPGITVDTFRDMELPYQVYRFRSGGSDTIDERIVARPSRNPAERGWNKTRLFFVGFALVLIAGYFGFRKATAG
jgi:hypothetical protein